MTIYSLIDTFTSLPAWTVLSGASILQGGNPYFLPDFADRFEMYPSLALRIGKLGKGISPRFADRYIDSIAPCAVIIATDLLASLRESGLPWTPAICYDRSLALGKFEKRPLSTIGDTKVTGIMTSGDKSATLDWTSTSEDAANAICTISRDNTLKTGDIIVLPWKRAGLPIEIGMKATLMLDDEESVKFNIR